jgi:alpha-beta hydrolase superfamily lysophospholipase
MKPSWTEQDVTQRGLHGTLTMPDQSGPVSAVLILAGSGPVDRDGNLPNLRSDALKMLARQLAEQGIASLRTDKRGIGQSLADTTNEADLRFDTYVADAIAWLDFLQSQQHIADVFLLGHSEGALVATRAAHRSKTSGLILIAGASLPASQLIEQQLSAAKLDPALLKRVREIDADLTQGIAVTDVPAELSALYRPSVQGYLMSWFALDPVQELRQTGCPVLIVQGTTDLQVTVEDAQRLAGAKPTARLDLIAGMNHVLKPAPEDRAANFATYNDPQLPLAPQLVPSIAQWIRAHV